MGDLQPIMGQIVAWLQANGIDPLSVPMAERPIVTRTTIVLEVWNRPLRLDPEMGGPAGRVDAVPLVVAPTGGVIRWLLGEVKAGPPR